MGSTMTTASQNETLKCFKTLCTLTKCCACHGMENDLANHLSWRPRPADVLATCRKYDVSKHQNVPEGPRRPGNVMTEKGARRAGKVAHQPARSKCTWTSKRTFVRAGADKRATTRPLNEPGLYSYNKNPSVWTAFAEKSRNNSGP